ncbi:hypothetical protein PG994_013614 [Apiospora phragmitis]|uniref:Uncharacterized protein n=1 Tax=Apiospora phragmitis TaxID=2905665 RepID=A0ABR1TAX2_9PEZI
MENFNHTISWRKQGRYKDDPVTVRWALGGDVRWELSKSDQPRISLLIPQCLRHGGTTDTTETHAIFNPGRIVRELYQDVLSESHGGSKTNNNSSYSFSDALALYGPYNTVSNTVEIRLPAAADPKAYHNSQDNVPYILSDQFMVAPSYAGKFLDAQKKLGHKEEHKKWRLGVGIAVGLGVPILMAATAWATWVVAKRRLGGRHAVASILLKSKKQEFLGSTCTITTSHYWPMSYNAFVS